jgi:hypothetical protein
VPADARGHLLLCLATSAAACADDPLTVVESREYVVEAADGRPLPSVHPCPAPFGEGSEAWVTFGGGTLVLWGNGSYTWTYMLGEGYSYHGPAGVKQGRGWTSTDFGRYQVDPTGRITFFRDGTPRAEGRMVDGRVELASPSVSCPHAAPDTPAHSFSLVLR